MKDELNETNRVLMNHVCELKKKIKEEGGVR